MKKHPQSIRISENSCFFQFWTEDPNEPFGDPKSFTHYQAFKRTLIRLKAIGFKVMEDPRIKQQYRVLTKYHRYGIWKGMEVDIEIFPRGFRLEFYQNIWMRERQPGDGKHEFDKFKLMDYIMQKRLQYVFRSIIDKLKLVYPDVHIEHIDTPKMSEQAILKHVQDNHWRKFSPKTLGEINASDRDDMEYNRKDRDGVLMQSGDTRYYRHRDGRIYRGTVYHHINNMWWVRFNKFWYSNIACFYLFTPTPEDYAQRRVVKDRMPEAKKRELELINSLPESTLRKLLRKKSIARKIA